MVNQFVELETFRNRLNKILNDTCKTLLTGVPIVTIGNSSYSVISGNTIKLGCTVSGSPAATAVGWQRTVGTVTGDINVDGSKYSGGNITTPELGIRRANPSDQGYYRCTAYNAVGKGQSLSTYLYVTGSKFCTINMSGQVKIHAHISSSPAVLVFYHKHVMSGFISGNRVI